MALYKFVLLLLLLLLLVCRRRRCDNLNSWVGCRLDSETL